MSASTTTASGSTAPPKNTNTSAMLSKEESIRKMAAEAEAKRAANVATQRRKLEMAERKLAEERSSKGKNSVLKDKSSRPTHRPAKKNRKPLSPPSNKEHDTRTATLETKAVIKEKEQLANLSIPRPSLNFDRIVEQRLVNGVVERVTQPADTPQAAASDIETDSDPAAGSDNDAEGDVFQLIRESSTPDQSTDSSEDGVGPVEAASATALSHVYDNVSMIDADDEALLSSSTREAAGEAPQPVKETISEVSSCCPSAILSMPNEAVYPSRLSRDEEAALVAIHVALVELPVTVFKQQKLTKAEKNAAKAAEIPKKVTTVESEVLQKQPELDRVDTTTGIAEPITPADDGYVVALLKMTNGPDITEASRDLYEKLVAMHIAPLSLPVPAPEQQKNSRAERKAVKAVKADRKTPVSGKTDEPGFVASLLSKSNGPGRTKEARDLHNNLVQMHVASPELPLSFQQQKKTKKAKSADTVVAKPIHKPAIIDTSAVDKELIVADDHTFAVSELNADDFTHDEETLIEDVSKLGLFPFTKAKANLHQVDVQVVDTINRQIAVIPDDTTPMTPPTSDPDLSSSNSDCPKSTKTSRRSSLGSSVESVRRKAEKARTTFLGETSLEMFVNTLEFELCDGTTTKDDVCEAFASLAGRPTTGLESVKVQRKIKIGGTSLYGFLRQLDFDDNEATVIGKVIKAFNEAVKNELISSKLDVALWLAESSQDEGSRQGLRSQRISPVGGFGQFAA